MILTGVALACGLSLVGCSGEADTGSRGEPDLGITPAVTDYAEIAFPLDEFRTRPEDALTLRQAQDVAIHACMARFGLEYPMPERKPTPDIDRPIGVISLDEAKSFGYRSPYTSDVDAVDAANEKKQPLSLEALSVLNGAGEGTVNGVAVPAGGCAGEALQKIGNRNPSGENVVIGLAADAYAAAEKDSRVRAAFTKWSQCMADSGYHYRDPWAAHNDPRFATDEATAEETATAQADVSCRNDVKLTGTWVAAIIAYQEQIIDANQETLNERKNEIATQLTKAEAILSN